MSGTRSKSKSEASGGAAIAAKEKRGVGRPTKATPDLIAAICDRYALGESVRSICADPKMPARSTLHLWAMDNEQFRTAFARAREMNADSIEDAMADIEKQVLAGLVEPSAANVVLSSQRWRARVLHPNRYGDKLGVDHTGKVGLSFSIDLSE